MRDTSAVLHWVDRLVVIKSCKLQWACQCAMDARRHGGSASVQRPPESRFRTRCGRLAGRPAAQVMLR